MKNLLLAGISMIQVVYAHEFLILNDMHYETNYTEECKIGNCLDKGVFGRNSPLSLIETVLDEASKNKDKYSAVII